MFFNDLAVYRKSIYKMLDEEYDCEWYIEDIDTGVKEFAETELKKVHRLPIRKLGPFYRVKGLLKLLREDFDIYLMLGSTRNISLFTFCICKRLFAPKKRVYYWSHGFYGKETRLEISLWKKPLFKLPNAIFTYGEYSKSLMIKNGFDPDKIHPIHNSLDFDRQMELRKRIRVSKLYEEHFGNDYPVLIMIGRLNLRKHLDMLFDAAAILKERGNIYNIVIIGDGEDRVKLEQLSIHLGLQNNTWFYGACYDEVRNAELLLNADLCVVPGDIGLTAIHSLMFGVPVITHNCYKLQGPEFEVIKDGETGAFYEYGSVTDLAAKIGDWFAKNGNNRERIRVVCNNEIDSFWNPYFQIEVFKKYLI